MFARRSSFFVLLPSNQTWEEVAVKIFTSASLDDCSICQALVTLMNVIQWSVWRHSAVFTLEADYSTQYWPFEVYIRWQRVCQCLASTWLSASLTSHTLWRWARTRGSWRWPTDLHIFFIIIRQIIGHTGLHLFQFLSWDKICILRCRINNNAVSEFKQHAKNVDWHNKCI